MNTHTLTLFHTHIHTRTHTHTLTQLCLGALDVVVGDLALMLKQILNLSTVGIT